MLLDLIFILTMGEPEVAHKASAPAIKKPLNLFTVPSTDVTLKKGSFAVHNPIQVGVNPIEFIVRSNTEYNLLAQGYFTIEGKINENDGNPIGKLLIFIQLRIYFIR